jgi:hypothetical protein
MRLAFETDKTPKELAEEAREAYDDPGRRAALAADRARFAYAVAMVLAADDKPDSGEGSGGDVLFFAGAGCAKWFNKMHLSVMLAIEEAEHGQFEFAHEWLSDAEIYKAAGDECLEEIS